MATSHTGENATQGKTCRCGEGDPNVRATRTSDNPDKQLPKCSICQVYKSGPLFISSKGIGWTSWKKRWFILTRTSLVFYRSDPNATPQKGSEPNLTLGGIDLNSSGSIVVKADKKLLTVLFPDGRDGRTFTLKAETSEDLYEWKIALENAVAQAPSAALALGQNGILSNDIADSIEASFEQWRDRRPMKSSVVGRPILLALEDIDGSPSFLEKALTFIEEHGIKVEGILRQSADVEEVERRVQEYEQGKNEFSSNEDAHVIGDCIKHVIRELPSSPVPASCCTALVEAYRTDRGSRINAMHAAITETFPEPNRRLVQRILKMMRTVASHKSVNRMTLSALAACMAPLLLRPLLAGDCELEDDFNMGGDGSIQLLQAAAAANHAQAIVIILLEEYEKIFDDDLLEEDSLSSELYSESEDGDVEDEDLTDNDILEDGYHDADNGLEADVDEDLDCSSSGTLGDSNSDDGSDLFDHKVSEEHSTGSSSPLNNKHPCVKKDDLSKSENRSSVESSHESLGCISRCRTSRGSMVESVGHTSTSNITKCVGKSNEPLPSIKRPTVWGRTSARKNLSMESIDYSSEDEIAVQRLEMTKTDIQTKITKEAEGNAILQASLEKRKEALHERRLALEQDVERLREQLQKERDLRSSLEDGLMNLRPGHLLTTSTMDGKTRADLEEVALAEADIINLKQKVTDLRGQLTNQLHYGYDSLCQSCSRHLYEMQQSTEKVQQTGADNASLLHQNENASNDENVLSEVELGNVHEQKQDLSPPNNTMSSGFNDPATISFSKKSSAKDQNAAFQADHENINTQTPESPSSPETQPPMKQHQKVSTISLGPTNASHSKKPSIIVCNAGSKKNTSRDENSTHGTECGNAKTRAQGSPSSPDKKPPQKFQSNTANWSGKEFRGPNGASSIEPTHSTSSAEDPTTIFRGDTASKNSALSDDNSKFRGEYGTSKSEAQDSQCRTKSLGSAEETTFGCISASKKFSLRGDAVKKETQDPASQKQQLSSVNLKSIGSRSEEMATINHNAASKKFTSGEQTAPSASSALTKLTSRLNFLKERRVQLVNELQNLDTDYGSCPLPGTNSI